MIWLEIYIVADVEVHAASHIFDHEAVASRLSVLEIDVPHVRACHVLSIGFLIGFCCAHPESHLSRLLFLSCLSII